MKSSCLWPTALLDHSLLLGLLAWAVRVPLCPLWCGWGAGEGLIFLHHASLPNRRAQTSVKDDEAWLCVTAGEKQLMNSSP